MSFPWHDVSLVIPTLTLSLLTFGCSDDGFAPGLTGGGGASTTAEASGTADPASATGPNNGTGADSTGGRVDGSSGPGPGSTGDPPPADTESGSTGVSDSGPSGSSDSGSTDGSDSGSTGGSDSGSTGGGSTGSTGGVNPFMGDYDGTWDGMCIGFGAVNGTLMFNVAPDGVLAGTFAGLDGGPLDGTVDDMGVIAAIGTGMFVGMCDFTGQIDMMGDVVGMWSCPLGCSGTWVAQQL